MSPTVATPAKILLIDANVFLARRITEALKLKALKWCTPRNPVMP